MILNTKLSIFKKDLEWTYRPFLVILGNGLVTADGLSWRKQRLLLSAHLRIDILEFIPDMAIRAVQRLALKLDKAKRENSLINMADEFRHLTLQVIAEAVLSISAEESDKTFADMYLPIVEEGNKRTWNPTREWLPTPEYFHYKAACARLDDYVTDLIQQRWNLRQVEAEAVKVSGSSSVSSGRKQDILDKILGAIPIEDWNLDALEQVRGEVKTFILAGHETSASMLTWALFELSLDPIMRSRVVTEATTTFGPPRRHTDGSAVINTDIPSQDILRNELAFSECCLRESLRKYSNVPSVVRVASEDCQVGPHFFRKGTTIMVNIQGVHHDSEYWVDPLRYDPTRFERPYEKYAFLPFIEGPRTCLGQFLALLESKIVLALVSQNYSFECENVEQASLKHAFMVPIIPRYGHMMYVK